MPILLDLFLTFLEIGTVSFGGGYAMIPLVTDKVVGKGWLTNSQILNYIAVCESTPGPIAINMATFVGSSQGGFIGAVLATFGVVLPSFILILIIASLVKGLINYKGVQAFLGGIRPVVVGLITATGVALMLSVILSLETFYNDVSFDWKALVIFSIIAITHLVYKKIKKKAISPILLILISAILGIIFYGLL